VLYIRPLAFGWGDGGGAPREGPRGQVIPAFLADVLKQHQKEAVAFLWRGELCTDPPGGHRTVADEMGLGKAAIPSPSSPARAAK
jgi:SNF2 family DNA or RNA helicase